MTRPAGGALPRPGRRRLILALAGLPLLAAGLLTLFLRHGPGARCEEISMPAYFSSGVAWARAIDSQPAPAIMILDITGSGAGSTREAAYAAAVTRAQAAGIKVLGYASTDYARRPAAAVEADVRHYRAWYHVTGIFLDEAATGTGELSYYRALTGYIRHADPRALVMLNPGTYPSRRYMTLGDVVLAYEGNYARYASLRVPGWVDRYPAARFSQVVYATPGSRLAEALRLAVRRHAGYVYVTDMAGRNPYRSLPGYWAAETTDAAGMCQGRPGGGGPGGGGR
jgi:spherulation-specific family 4 protein